MLTAEVQLPMKKSAQNEGDKPARDTVPVKIDRDLHRKLKMLALSKNRELYEYLDDLLRPIVEKGYKQLVRE